MPEKMADLLKQYAEKIHHIYGKLLAAVILYGSYARGDYTSDFDVDIMILVKIPEDKIRKFKDSVSEYLIKYGIDISPIIVSEEHFNYLVDSLPYYRNVRGEGIVVDVG